MRFEDLTRTVVDRSPHEPPPVAEIAARAHRRTVRRRTAIGLVCAAFLVLGVAGAGALTSSEDHVQLMTDPPPGSAPGTTSGIPGTTVEAAPASYAIDLSAGLEYGGRSLERGNTSVLPVELVIVDDDTVSMFWIASCNEPAEAVFVEQSEEYLHLRLVLTRFAITDCVGEPDRWFATFDLRQQIGDRRLAATVVDDGQVHYRDASSDGRVMPHGPPFAAAPEGTANVSGLLRQLDGDTFAALPPYVCFDDFSVAATTVGNVVVPIAWASPAAPASCSEINMTTIPLEGRRMIGFEE